MGFFVRSKKVKKNSPSSKDRGQAPSHYQPPPPPSAHALPWHPDGSYQQPAGRLPPPPGWSETPQPQPLYQQSRPYPPIIVNQHHYYLGGASPPSSQVSTRPCPLNTSFGRLNLGSAVDLAKDLCQSTGIPQLLNDTLPVWHQCGGQLVKQGNTMADQIIHEFDNMLTMIDQGRYNGKEQDIFTWQPPQAPAPVPLTEKGRSRSRRRDHRKDHPKGQTTTAAAVVSESFFAKVDRYANSRLPLNLPPLKLYIPTYPLLCLAAQYSETVYSQPRSPSERDAHISADWLSGTKAMVIKSLPMDYMNTIVFAVRGTSSFLDWTTNLQMSPASPRGFLDDPGNLCHAGFLSVARKMVHPVAQRLRQLLEEDPGRASYSLLITGHSAGGAVAALLYSHMLSTSKDAESELNAVAGCFKRVHCVTFGTPPVSLIPLAKPVGRGREDERRLRKSLFLSFVNEGDPVARADRAYVRSLLELFVAPAPELARGSSRDGERTGRSREGKGEGGRRTRSHRPVWKVPPCTLSCAGRIVVLRSGSPGRGGKTVEERLREGVVAQVVTDEELRGVVWGDPVAHMMRLYAARVEVLAVGAVTAKG